MRDIIYFDRERAASFYAQLARGLPTTQIRTSQRRKSGSLLGELAIPFFSKGQGTANLTHVIIQICFFELTEYSIIARLIIFVVI
jgi:hypothetical protein